PLRRLLGPGALEPAGDRVGPPAGAEGVLPAEALLLEGRALRFGADVLERGGRTVSLAERVSTGDERDRLLVVHRHTTEGLPNVPPGKLRVRVAARSLGIHVDKAHVIGAERPLDLPVVGVALVSEPRVLGTPEDLFGLPDIRSPEAEAERLEPHRLHGDVAGVHQQIGP